MIDFHTHIFPEKIVKPTLEFLESKCQTKPATDGTYEGLRSSMEKAGITCSVVLPVVTKPSQFSSVLNFAVQVTGEGVISFGGIHPDSGNYREELKAIHDAGLKGIKLHPDYQGVFIDDIRYKRIIEYASELGLIISVHAGFDPGYPECTHCTPQRARNVIDEVKPSKLVLAHMGGFQRWDEVEEYLIGQPVWLDTAVVFGFLPKEQFLRMVRHHGERRILFATDSPWADQSIFAEYFQNLPLKETEKNSISVQNALELLELV